MQEAEVPLETILAQYRMLGRKLIKEEIKDGMVTIKIRELVQLYEASYFFVLYQVPVRLKEDQIPVLRVEAGCFCSYWVEKSMKI